MAITPFLAFDTETDIVDLSREVPSMALCGVTNGRRSVIVQPERMAEFILAHQGAKWVGFNVAFDWWVVWEALKRTAIEEPGYLAACDEWRKVLSEGRLHDAMLMDVLARLADPQAAVHGMRDLGTVGQDWLGVPLDKRDPYRMRFGELIGTDWRKAEPGFWEYAIKDVIVTHAVTPRIWHAAQERAVEAPRGPLSRKHGLLTEQIQVKASIVLAEVGRNGLMIDRDGVDSAIVNLKGDVAEHVAALQDIDRNLFDYYKVRSRTTGAMPGDLKVNSRTGTPMLTMATLRGHLQAIADDLDIEQRYLPRTAKEGLLGTGLDAWREIAPDHPLVHHWAQMADTSKILQFLVKLDGRSVHPRYRVLVRTGRTSATDPNIQQMPRIKWFRGLFHARPGHTLAIVDYSFIELRTLAAECLRRFGESKLADTIKAGRDPHVYTASMVNRVSYEEYAAKLKAEKAAGKAWEESGKQGPVPETLYAQGRQAAKAINFGVPGGLGAKKLAMYAKANYGVEMSEVEAKHLRQQLIEVVYPELSRYLSDSIVERTAASLGCTPERLSQALGMDDVGHDDPKWHFVSRIVNGVGKLGGAYSGPIIDRVWEGLEAACQNEEIRPMLERREAGHKLGIKLFGETVSTITGRVRAGLTFSEARNTPFQGLAADGAKIALWRLWEAGYRIVAFIHDEAVVELPEDGAEAALKDIERIMNESMEYAWEYDLPCAVEGHLSERWSK